MWTEAFEIILSSFLTVFISEVGDKTFISTAMLAMKYSKSAVFCGNIISMTSMMFLASCIGYTVMIYISPEIIKMFSILVFFYFAYEGFSEAFSNSKDEDLLDAKLTTYKWTSIMWQTAVLVFFAEWGDKSQIGIIALSATHSVVYVLIGAFLAIFLCAVMAIVSGHLCSGYLSESLMSSFSGIIFLSFGLFSLKDFIVYY